MHNKINCLSSTSLLRFEAKAKWLHKSCYKERSGKSEVSFLISTWFSLSFQRKFNIKLKVSSLLTSRIASRKHMHTCAYIEKHSYNLIR